MVFSSSLVFLLFVGALGTESADSLGQFCNQDTRISSSSLISANIDHLLAKLVSEAFLTAYAATSYGKNPDKVYGLARCKGVVISEDRSSCIRDAAKQIRQRCPNHADAKIWYDHCFLRFSNKKLGGGCDKSFSVSYINIEKVTDTESFLKEIGLVMDKVRSQAPVTRNGLRKLETIVLQFVTVCNGTGHEGPISDGFCSMPGNYC
ncbi:cysteine-rich repeat secretory protein 55-like [Durio zibethinus]|uniref:Cysteine-rich repeat secretory protein 55-like n=1 Tax=Durio zibethinus TaxID=66656 RepID=A0A6P5XJA5_DURZI|nr:cysteine-rich repeat secretory protein 55-like [Durio zibethinus]